MKTFPALLALTILSANAVFAGDDGKAVIPPAPAITSPFDRGTWELEGGAGFYASLSFTGAPRPTVNYEMQDLRLGWMYDSPRHEGFLRGNNEFLIEALYGDVTRGPGSYITGFSPLWRYNFVQPDSHFVPYIQLGAGAVANNVFKSQRQAEIGERFEFLLQGEFGLTYLINDRWSVSSEFGIRHISNAGFSHRNEGLNGLGGLMQLSYYFP